MYFAIFAIAIIILLLLEAMWRMAAELHRIATILELTASKPNSEKETLT